MLYEKLANIMAAGRISHAWLLTGRQEQVLEQAVMLAKALLCHDLQPDGQPCGRCAACRKLAAGNHPDLQLVSPKGASVKVEQTRAMQYLANLEAYEGGRRVVIIHQAHTMPPAAANSLLKILEEPREGLYFILTAPLGDSLLETILSRVVWLRLPENLAAGEDAANADIFLQGYLPELVRERELREAVRERCCRLLELLPKAGAQAELVLLARGLRDQAKQSGTSLKRLAAYFLDELLEKLQEAAAAVLSGRPMLVSAQGAVRMGLLVEDARRDCDGNVNPVLLLSVLFLQLADITQA